MPPPTSQLAGIGDNFTPKPYNYNCLEAIPFVVND